MGVSWTFCGVFGGADLRCCGVVGSEGAVGLKFKDWFLHIVLSGVVGCVFRVLMVWLEEREGDFGVGVAVITCRHRNILWVCGEFGSLLWWPAC